MKLSRILFSLITSAIFLGATSCLSDDPDHGTEVRKGNDVAVVKLYTEMSVLFDVASVDGNTITLQATQNAAIDPEKYPVGSRIFIDYSMRTGQNMNQTVMIDLLSTRPVTTVGLTDATHEQCKLDYRYFTVIATYLAGGYINLNTSIDRAKSRTWKCLLDTENSDGDIANLYLIPTAEDPDYVSTTEIVSIDVNQLLNRYSEIHLHLNNEQSNDFVFSYPVIKVS